MLFKGQYMVTDLKSILNTWYPNRDNQEWVLATLYKIEGSSYRKLGAMMAKGTTVLSICQEDGFESEIANPYAVE